MNTLPTTFYRRDISISIAFYFIFAFLAGPALKAQTVTEAITDFGGYWKSSSAANPVKPNTSHNLLAFTLNGTRYSTGVNDALLATNGETFLPADFKALPVSSISSAATTNTKVAVGSLYDGMLNGAGATPLSNSMSHYLIDGPKGLDIGTGIANLPPGTLSFTVSSVDLTLVNDAHPDILITQIADPTGASFDTYEFIDAGGVRVGSAIDVAFGGTPGIAAVGTWTADFYEASQNPMTLGASFTESDRPLRLWAADLSAFGINASNYASVAAFRITLNGNSDIAFVAYNRTTITVLPVSLNRFTAVALNGISELSWQTDKEESADHFEVQWSTDGNSFSTIHSLLAAGNSSSTRKYTYVHTAPVAGANYYRLKMVDRDGRFTYSKMVQTQVAKKAALVLQYSAGNGLLRVHYPAATPNATLQVVNMQGSILSMQKIPAGTTSTALPIGTLSKGVYQVVYIRGREKLVGQLVVH